VLAERGDRVVIADADHAGAEAAVAELVGRGFDAVAVRLDVSHAAEVARVVAAADAAAPLGTVVNNAGIGHSRLARRDRLGGRLPDLRRRQLRDRRLRAGRRRLARSGLTHGAGGVDRVPRAAVVGRGCGGGAHAEGGAAGRRQGGGGGRRRLGVIALDDEREPEPAAELVARLAADSAVVGVVGPKNSGCARAAIPVARQAGCPCCSGRDR
jgi:hypothetical protein